MRGAGNLNVDHPDPGVGGGSYSGRHQAADAHVPLARQAAQLLSLEMMHCEDVGGHHYHHRDVEREERTNHLNNHEDIKLLINFYSFLGDS